MKCKVYPDLLPGYNSFGCAILSTTARRECKKQIRIHFISNKSDVSQGSAHNVIMDMLDHTCAIAECYIVWPNDSQKSKTVQATLFRRVCRIDRIVGAIGGCHFRIRGVI